MFFAPRTAPRRGYQRPWIVVYNESDTAPQQESRPLRIFCKQHYITLHHEGAMRRGAVLKACRADTLTNSVKFCLHLKSESIQLVFRNQRDHDNDDDYYCFCHSCLLQPYWWDVNHLRTAAKAKTPSAFTFSLSQRPNLKMPTLTLEPERSRILASQISILMPQTLGRHESGGKNQDLVSGITCRRCWRMLVLQKGKL